MKKSSHILLAVISCFTFQAVAQSSVSIATESAVVREFLKEEKIDVEKFNQLPTSDRVKIATEIVADPNYLQKAIEVTETTTTQTKVDPNVLVQATVVKEDLKKEVFTANYLEEYLQKIDRSVAAQASFPLVTASGKVNSNVFAVQYIAYKEFPEDSGTYLGYGLYMTIDVSAIEGSAATSLPYLAANATILNQNFNFNARLVGIEGVSAHELMKNAMPGSSFDIETFVGYQKFKDALIAGLKDKSIKISPVKIDPLVKLGAMEGDAIALARVHALISIAKRVKLSDALSTYKDQTNDAYAVIKKVYLDHAQIKKLNDKPSQKQSENAKSILKSVGVIV